jgi:hypothetical protein
MLQCQLTTSAGFDSRYEENEDEFDIYENKTNG